VVLAVPVPGAAAAPGPAGRAGGVPLPPASSGQWWFSALRIGDVWTTGARGQGVTVAVVDVGVDAARPELAGRVLPGTDPAGGDGRRDLDPDRHGSSMAVLIAGQGTGTGLTGIAPQASILPVGDRDDPAGGIVWAVDHGAKVISMSIAAPHPCSEAASLAVRYAVDRGAVLVAAAGNDGLTAPDEATDPAGCPGVLAVGAVNPGDHVWPGSSPGDYLALAAPGTDVPVLIARPTPQPGGGVAGLHRAIGNGTSPAAALVSATAALIWSARPGLTNRQVVARLLATAGDDADRPGLDRHTGFGIVRPLPAVSGPVPDDAPNPVFDALDRTLPPGSVRLDAGGRPVRGSQGGAGATGTAGTAAGGSATPGGSAVRRAEQTGRTVVLVGVVLAAGFLVSAGGGGRRGGGRGPAAQGGQSAATAAAASTRSTATVTSTRSGFGRGVRYRTAYRATASAISAGSVRSAATPSRVIQRRPST
jgi:subtilisin family serine protease